MRRAVTESASILGVVIIGLLIPAWATVYKEEVPLKDIVVSLFTVSGALVALILPAAGIVGPFLTQQLDLSIDRVLEAADDQGGKLAKAHLAILDRYRAVGWAAWRASVYSMVALVLSAGAFFVGKITMGAHTLYLEHLLAGFSLGCILVGALWFCIPAYRLYRFKVGKETKVLLDHARRRSAAKSNAPPNAPASTQAPPAPASETAPGTRLDRCPKGPATPLLHPLPGLQPAGRQAGNSTLDG
jgi:hypothetical protein